MDVRPRSSHAWSAGVRDVSGPRRTTSDCAATETSTETTTSWSPAQRVLIPVQADRSRRALPRSKGRQQRARLAAEGTYAA
jgi:hypothetical protein